LQTESLITRILRLLNFEFVKAIYRTIQLSSLGAKVTANAQAVQKRNRQLRGNEAMSGVKCLKKTKKKFRLKKLRRLS
jgi:hypothetical protein